MIILYVCGGSFLSTFCVPASHLSFSFLLQLSPTVNLVVFVLTRPCPLLTRQRHTVAFRLYLSGTACLLVAQALYIKRQGACYRVLCHRGGLTVENEASASYADLSPNQYDVVAPLFTFIPLLRPLSRALAFSLFLTVPLSTIFFISRFSFTGCLSQSHVCLFFLSFLRNHSIVPVSPTAGGCSLARRCP